MLFDLPNLYITSMDSGGVFQAQIHSWLDTRAKAMGELHEIYH
jgi:hypothetical protein